MPPKRGAKAYSLAKPLPPGEIMTDMLKKRWVLGAPIGQGGFGLIYLAGILNITLTVDAHCCVSSRK